MKENNFNFGDALMLALVLAAAVWFANNKGGLSFDTKLKQQTNEQ